MSPLTFGYLLPTQEATGDNSARIGALLELGAEAERHGFDTVWLPDSPFQYGLPDPLLVIAALAARTRQITLASGVLLAALRHPALLAQQLASLDALAGGRLRAGFGLGFPSPDSRRQFETAGVPFAKRVTLLEEAVALMRVLWSAPGQLVSYRGQQVAVDDLVLSPAPARTGGPPIWLAGAGARAERRVGRLADGWLPYLPNAHDYGEGWMRVQDAAADAGRVNPPVAALYLTVSLDRSESIARRRLRATVEGWYGRPFELIASLQAMYAGTPDGLGAYLEPYVRAGLEHVVLRVADAPERGLEAASRAVWQAFGGRLVTPSKLGPPQTV
jgi:alkanesulfonate monooxygenase SsuD/methylene tetrahydromethanopterin reductase-like flavin-dependent oxidoreductase (luciferase family)